MAEQLNLYQANLAEKSKQLKAMGAELALHRQQVTDLKLDQESLIAKIATAKKRYFAMKMKQRTQAAGGSGYIMDLGGVTGYEGAGSYDLSDFTAAPGTADFGDFSGPPPDDGDGYDGGGDAGGGGE